jgi:folylpolyglutamate synthase/dihydropteroate synthase
MLRIPDTPASLDAETLAEMGRRAGLETEAAASLVEAFGKIAALPDASRRPRILIAGSLYLAGYVLSNYS